MNRIHNSASIQMVSTAKIVQRQQEQTCMFRQKKLLFTEFPQLSVEPQRATNQSAPVSPSNRQPCDQPQEHSREGQDTGSSKQSRERGDQPSRTFISSRSSGALPCIVTHSTQPQSSSPQSSLPASGEELLRFKKSNDRYAGAAGRLRASQKENNNDKVL
jgi:hypothetical protein